MQQKELSQKAKNFLTKHGIKSNLQRIKIVIAIEAFAKRPFTTDQMIEYLTHQNNVMSRSCVYYTLIELANTGVLSRHLNIDGALEFSLLSLHGF